MQNIILKNALITGGNGMVGSHINFGYKPTSKQMDICDKQSIENYIKNMPNMSCIIHLAATNLRDSENNIKKAIDVNINGTTNILYFAKKYNIPFILVSTGAVFATKNPNIIFTENSISNPNSVYGFTKSASEKIALLYEKTTIIRTGWLFGGNQKTHYKFVETVINNFITKTEIKASNDFYGSPTYVNDLIEKMIYLINESKYGIYHIVNSGFGTGYDIATEISKILNTDNSLVLPVLSKDVPNSGPMRSNSEQLDTMYDFARMRSWKNSLSEYCKKYYQEKTNVMPMSYIDKSCNDKKWSNREKCRLCDSYDLNVFFNLEPTPPANHFVLKPTQQEVIPLDIAICSNCKHIQLIQQVDPVFQYSNYLYVSSTSNTMTKHLQNAVIEFTSDLNISKDDYILEIGANDGVCIKHLLENGFKNVIGIDPAENINKRHNLPIICDFFSSKMLDYFNEKYPKFHLIYAFHCCAHIEDIQDLFTTIFHILNDNGIFIMEVGYFYDVFKNNCFDTIYHEHIDYHTTKAIQIFALKNGLTLFNVKNNDIQGGSIQFFFSKNKDIIIKDSVYKSIQLENQIKLHDYTNLSNWKINIIKCGIDINLILNGLNSYGKKIIGYGASAKSTTFLYQYKLTNKNIDYIIDDNIYKQNYYSPGLHIPVKSSHILNIDKIDYIIILSWNFTEEILKKLKPYRELGIRIIIPFPEIKII
jgi:dTDP-4-dehydrorhamnose reductase